MTPLPVHETIIHALLEGASADPDKKLLCFLGDGVEVSDSLTAPQLLDYGAGIATQLAESAKPGDRVALLFPPGLDFACAFVGSLLAGMIPVLLALPRMPRDIQRILSIVGDARPAVISTTAAVQQQLQMLGAPLPPELRVHTVDRATLEGLGTGSEPAWLPEPHDVAFLQYTSGSTGAPKGVVISHSNAAHNLRDIIYSGGSKLGSDEVSLSWLPHFHDMGLMNNLMLPIFNHSTSILMGPDKFVRSPITWLRALSKFSIAYSGGPMFGYELCARKIRDEDLAGLDLSSWRQAFVGAEPLRHHSLRRFVDRFRPYGFDAKAIYPCYGLAEATVAVTGGTSGEGMVSRTIDGAALNRGVVEDVEASHPEARCLVSSGRTWYDTEITIVDTLTGLELEDNQPGEIWVRGPIIARGYWGHERSENFRGKLPTSEPWLRTGDLGFVSKGELFVTGRLKELIIVRGTNHFPQDIEATCIASSELLKPGRGIAFCPDEESGELVVLFELRRGVALEQLQVKELALDLREAISARHGLRLARFALMPAGGIARTTSGKVERIASARDFLAGKVEPLAQWPEAAR